MTGMKRSDFLKLGSLFGGGMIGGLSLGLSSCSTPGNGDKQLDWTAVTGSMIDHAAPAIPKVRIAMIGLGNRGSSLIEMLECCLLYTSPSPRDREKSRMPSSA